MVPTGATGKKFIDEISRLLNLWSNNTPHKNIALEAVHVMPAILLQKPSKTSKAKDHLKALERRLILWEEGTITELVNESKTIQDRLSSTNNQMNIEKLSSKFEQLMQKSNVNGALRLLTNNMSNDHFPTKPYKLWVWNIQKHMLTTKRCYKGHKNKYTTLFMKASIKI